MPTYDYKCNTCNLHMVVIRTLTEKERTPVCPNDGASLVREYTAPGVAFKGKGWGKDD